MTPTHINKKQKQLDYDWFPNDPDETNCNAYQGSIMRRNGGKLVDNDGNEINVDAPGFNHNIGNKFFER